MDPDIRPMARDLLLTTANGETECRMRRASPKVIDAASASPTRSVAAGDAADGGAATDSPLPDKIPRFLRTERLLHWALALPFLGCLFSAVALVVVYNPDPTRPYRYVFAWAHRGCGAALFILPSLVLLTSGRHMRVLLYNIRQAWGWRLDDIKWLMLMGPATVFKRIVLPDQGKFNAAEKLNFMMVMVFTPLFIASGIAIWLPDYTSLDPFAPWMFHCALAATGLPLILGHMFMAMINPETRVGLSGMITGSVSRTWAQHHYARWYREQFPHLVAAGGDHHKSGAEPATAAAVDGQTSPEVTSNELEQPRDATMRAAESRVACEDEYESSDPGGDEAGCVREAYFASDAGASRDVMAP